MIYKIGCFKCGTEADYDIQENTNQIKCIYCENQASAFSLLVDNMAFKDNKLADYKKALDEIANKSIVNSSSSSAMERIAKEVLAKYKQ